MQQTGVPITFRNASKFYRLATKTKERRNEYNYSNGDTESARGKFLSEKKRLGIFTRKLVEKSVPAILKETEQRRATPSEDVDKIVETIVFQTNYSMHGISGIWQALERMRDYKNSQEAKVSFRGQTFSSFMESLNFRSHALSNHQGVLAAAVYSEIKEHVEKMADRLG